MSSAPYLTCHNLALSHGTSELFKELSFAVHPGERWGIVGPNGAGKSSLFRLLRGEVKSDAGTVAFRSDLRVAYVTQFFDVDGDLTVKEVLKKALPFEFDLDAKTLKLEMDLEAHSEICVTNPKIVSDENWINKLTLLHDEMANLSGAGTENIIESALKAAQLTQLQDRPYSTLSGGQQKRVQIVSALLGHPQLLMLDEPTNHLDVQTVDWLEEFLLSVVEQGIGFLGFRSKDGQEEPFSYVIISHDRALLDTLVNRVLEIDGGTAKIYQGNYESYAEQRIAWDEVNEKTRSKMANLFKRELAWLRTGAKARTTKQTARIDRAHALDKQLKTREQQVATPKVSTMEFSAQMTAVERDANDSFIPVVQNLGHQELVRLEGVSVRHPMSAQGGGQQLPLLFQNLDLVVKPRMRIALLGPNGCGKSTLLKILAGINEPDSGKRQFHDLLKISYFDQQRNMLDRSLTVLKTICPEGDFVFFGTKYMHAMAYLERFLFWKFDADRKVSELSGGEQARLLLAQLMLEHGNLMILDEPTNDLDIPTLQALERNLFSFDGGMVFTSHDRYFVQRVATHILTYCGKVNVKGEMVGQWRICPDLDQALAELESLSEAETAPKAATVSKTGPSNLEPAPVNSPSTSKVKLSFKEQREFDGLESKILILEGSLSELTSRLEQAYAKSSPYIETARLAEEIDSKQSELDTTTKRWEQLFEKSS